MDGSALLQPVARPVRKLLSGREDGLSAVNRAIGRPAGAPGWFTPGDPIWTVHGSVATFLGGIRSLLLQALHPLALAGVMTHSDYRADPFGRLQRTGAFIAATTYGCAELATETVAAIAAMHSRVRGVAPDGRPYSAGDPDLLRWVHVALVDSMLTGYQLYGRDGAIDADGYVANMAVVGRAMGVLDPPESQAALDRQLRGFGPELEYSARTREAHEFISSPPVPAGMRPGYRVLSRAAHDSLPGWILELMGERPSWPRLDAAAAHAVLGMLRVALVESPSRIAGERRLAGLAP